MCKIAISGKANSGKSTIAQLFANNIVIKDRKYNIVALADPIKSIVKQMFPEASDECLYGPSELRSQIISSKYTDSNGKPLTHRQALLDLGAYGRKYNIDIWLNLLVEDAKRSLNISPYIISDVRYPSEFSYLKKSGFTMIRILRDNITKINDSSELDQDSIPDSEFDFVVKNNNSLDDLKIEIIRISSVLYGL